MAATSPTTTSVHWANLRAKMDKAASIAELKAASEKHTPHMTEADKALAREHYMRAVERIKELRHD